MKNKPIFLVFVVFLMMAAATAITPTDGVRSIDGDPADWIGNETSAPLYHEQSGVQVGTLFFTRDPNNHSYGYFEWVVPAGTMIVGDGETWVKFSGTKVAGDGLAPFEYFNEADGYADGAEGAGVVLCNPQELTAHANVTVDGEPQSIKTGPVEVDFCQPTAIGLTAFSADSPRNWSPVLIAATIFLFCVLVYIRRRR